MKVMTIVGTRPEIIRLSRVIDKCDRYFEHVLVLLPADICSMRLSIKPCMLNTSYRAR